MRINSIFSSLEGEGKLQGTRTVFVRTQGCDYKCPCCDTKESWDMNGGEEMSPKEVALEVIKELLGKNTAKISFTGGNPLLQINEIFEVIDILKTTVKLHDLGIILNLEHPGPNFNEMDDKNNFIHHLSNELYSHFNLITYDIKLNVFHSLLKNKYEKDKRGNYYKYLNKFIFPIIRSILSHNLYLTEDPSCNGATILPKIIVDYYSTNFLPFIFLEINKFCKYHSLRKQAHILISPIHDDKKAFDESIEFVLNNNYFYTLPTLNIQQHKYLEIK